MLDCGCLLLVAWDEQTVDGLHLKETQIVFCPCRNGEMQLNDDEQFIEAVELAKLIAARR